jgi:hypothetical protein
MKTILKLAGVILGLILVLLVVSALSNIGLPTESSSIETLSQLDKARAAEAVHLRSELGDRIWPEWESEQIPVILHNEEFAFLLGFPGEPPSGWVKVPSEQQQGGDWQVVPADTFQGEVYYRQSLVDRETTPENFTVRVGEEWVATFFTLEYAEIDFYQGFQEELPNILQPIFPYRLFWKLLMGSTETYLGGMAHESFHAYQGLRAPQRLAAAEDVASREDDYPWEDPGLKEAWSTELDLLNQAVSAENDHDALKFTREFLQQRQDRRQLDFITQQDIDFERNREWLEGLAKYTELELGLTASSTPGYQPVKGMAEDPGFKFYQRQERYFEQQIAEVKRRDNQSGESRFYYTGMAQAFLLDRFSPGWKSDIWQDGIWLEDLLEKAVN